MGHVVKQEKIPGKVKYYARYKTPSGNWRWECGGSRKKDAEAILRTRESEIATGTYGKQSTISFSEFSDKWLQDYAKLRVKPRTYNDYEQVVKNHLVPFFGKQMLESMSPVDVQEYVSQKVRSGLSARTVNKTITTLKTMLTHAVKWGYIRESPARFVERPRQARREMDYLSPEEVKRLLAAASPEYYPLFATAVLTGARQGELLALRWGDWDPEKDTLYIRRSYHPEQGFSEPKSKASERAVNVTPELANILSAHKENTGGAPNDLIFHNRAGNPIYHQNMMTREFHPALERAGIRRVRFHDLRHTFAALMISMDANMKWLQHQMGHASITTTMDRYGHLLPDAHNAMGQKMDALLFEDEIDSPDRK